MKKMSKYKGIRGNFSTLALETSDYGQLCIATDASNQVVAHMYLPEYKITPEIKSVAELMTGALEMFDLLESMSQFLLPGDLNQQINTLLDKVTDIDKPKIPFDMEAYKKKHGLS